MRFENQTAVVAACGSDAGAACALNYLQQGAKVALYYDEEARLWPFDQISEEERSRLLTIQISDFRDHEELKRAADQVKEKFGTCDIVVTAVTTVLTMFVKIPTPTRGYLNLSDTMIFFSSYAFGPWVGGIIGGLGPALSDLISGYPQWAIFTFIIDGLQAVLVGLLVREFKPANVVIGSLVAGVWKVFGYFIAGGILSGLGGR